MTPPPEGTPAYVWLLAIIIPTVTTALAGVVVALLNRPVRRTLKIVAADAREARQQTANTHDTNLRDDLDAMRSDIGEVRRSTGVVRRELRGVRRDVGSLQEDVAEVREEQRSVRRRLDEHLDPNP